MLIKETRLITRREIVSILSILDYDFPGDGNSFGSIGDRSRYNFVYRTLLNNRVTLRHRGKLQAFNISDVMRVFPGLREYFEAHGIISMDGEKMKDKNIDKNDKILKSEDVLDDTSLDLLQDDSLYLSDGEANSEAIPSDSKWESISEGLLMDTDLPNDVSSEIARDEINADMEDPSDEAVDDIVEDSKADDLTNGDLSDCPTLSSDDNELNDNDESTIDEDHGRCYSDSLTGSLTDEIDSSNDHFADSANELRRETNDTDDDTGIVAREFSKEAPGIASVRNQTGVADDILKNTSSYSSYDWFDDYQRESKRAEKLQRKVDDLDRQLTAEKKFSNLVLGQLRSQLRYFAQQVDRVEPFSVAPQDTWFLLRVVREYKRLSEKKKNKKALKQMLVKEIVYFAFLLKRDFELAKLQSGQALPEHIGHVFAYVFGLDASLETSALAKSVFDGRYADILLDIYSMDYLCDCIDNDLSDYCRQR